MRLWQDARSLFAAGILIQIALFGLLMGDAPRVNVPLFLVCFTTAFLAYILAVCARHTCSLRTILLFGALFRLTVLVIPPSLSDDIYRYVWDGAIQNVGTNPYSYAPDDVPADTAGRMGVDKEKINHPHLHTIYPPVAQLFFSCRNVFSRIHLVHQGRHSDSRLTCRLVHHRVASRLRPRPTCRVALLLESAPFGRRRDGRPHRTWWVLHFWWLALLYGQVSGPGRAAFVLALSAAHQVPARGFPALVVAMVCGGRKMPDRLAVSVRCFVLEDGSYRGCSRSSARHFTWHTLNPG